MDELMNCPSCNKLFVKTNLRDVCPDCWKEEENAYNTVYEFMRQRTNRAATMEQVVEATGVEEDLLLKFIRTGRLKLTHFPNLGYPCDKCGSIIREGKLCKKCVDQIRNDLDTHQAEEQRQKELQSGKHATYFSVDNKR